MPGSRLQDLDNIGAHEGLAAVALELQAQSCARQVCEVRTHHSTTDVAVTP